MKRKDFLTGLVGAIATPFVGFKAIGKSEEIVETDPIVLTGSFEAIETVAVDPEPDEIIVTGKLVGLMYTYDPATLTLRITGDVSRLGEADLTIRGLGNKNISDLNIVFN